MILKILLLESKQVLNWNKNAAFVRVPATYSFRLFFPSYSDLYICISVKFQNLSESRSNLTKSVIMVSSNPYQQKYKVSV